MTIIAFSNETTDYVGLRKEKKNKDAPLETINARFFISSITWFVR